MPEFALPLDSVESHEWLDGLPDIARGYVTAAFWTGVQYSDDRLDGVEIDGLGPANIPAARRDDWTADALRFWLENAADLATACEAPGYDMERAGVDFWLTRNHHGAGFWDRGLGDVGDRLTTAAHGFGESDLFAQWTGEGRAKPDRAEGFAVHLAQSVSPLTDAERAALLILTGPPVDPLPHVGGRYGAPMGRDQFDPAPGEVLTARRVTLDPQGYDSGGAYWGTGAPLWRLLGADGATVGYRRAATAGEAVAACMSAPARRGWPEVTA